MSSGALGNVDALFAPLVAAIAEGNRRARASGPNAPLPRLVVRQAPELIDVEYHGDTHILDANDDHIPILDDLLKLLASPVVASRLRSFRFRTPARWGANGVCDYNIDPLIGAQGDFPNLTLLSLDEGGGEGGVKLLNSESLRTYLSEGGVLSEMLAKAPRLERLQAPVTPTGPFFQGPEHPLLVLSVNAALTHSDFILRLASSSRFPCLQKLVFTDFTQTMESDWRDQTTSFDDYASFFKSPVASQLKSIRLLDVNLSRDEVRRLKEIRSQGVRIVRHTIPDHY